jgi:hypothetical protein
MDISKANPHQLELTMGNIGIGIMSSAVLSSPARSKSTIDGGQIFFGTIDFSTTPTHPSSGLRQLRPGDRSDDRKPQFFASGLRALFAFHI